MGAGMVIVTLARLIFTNKALSGCTVLPDMTLLDCVNECRLEKTCLAILHSRSLQACCLRQHRYTTLDHFSDFHTSYYYWLYPDYCHPDTGYTLSRQADLCFRVYTGQKTWDSANQACEMDGGSLIKLNTPRKIHYIKSVITSNQDYESMEFAIGGKLSAGLWAWSDESQIDINDWDENHPTADSSQSRVVMEMTSGHRWRNVDPAGERAYICELPFISLDPYV
ncbi:galactose-specific lectin nattectin-like [Haliotis rufescens]|uniref:galactose-specific lectin nattectin-like n=1 Tax=Haliotis rufescens TaxID=6454 RepID=UPI00201ED2AB|nr:galactose-specific lectin nattectin-like [Haliotis rufescens]